MKKYFLFSLVLCLTLSAIAAPQMEVEPQNVLYGDAVQLILSDDKPIRNLPDLSSLQTNFVSGGQEEMHNTLIINDTRKETHQVILTLFPKKTGVLQIGPFTWNGTTLPAQTISVNENTRKTLKQSNPDSSQPTPQEVADQNRLLKAEAFLNPSEIYIGESTLYTIRLTENTGLTQAQIQTPKDARFTLTPFGQDKMIKTNINGTPAKIYERSFLITPLEAGTIHLSDAAISGLAPDKTAFKSNRFPTFPDFFDDEFFNRGVMIPQKEIYAPANEITLTVKQKPADWVGWWLPSRHVELTEQYKMPEKIYVGQPLERHILLTAQDVAGDKLPLITQLTVSSIQTYANPEKRTTTDKENTLLGLEEIMFVMIPTQAGEITIPAIQIDWFNTQTHQKSTAQLPAKTIQVLPVDGMAATESNSTESAVLSNISASDSLPQQLADTQADTKSASQSKTPTPTAKSFQAAFEKIMAVFGIFELIMTLVFLLGLALFIYIIRKIREKKRYLYYYQKPIKRKRKKPLPDLYPFE